jgi:hypothetical protein
MKILCHNRHNLIQRAHERPVKGSRFSRPSFLAPLDLGCDVVTGEAAPGVHVALPGNRRGHAHASRRLISKAFSGRANPAGLVSGHCSARTPVWLAVLSFVDLVVSGGFVTPSESLLGPSADVLFARDRVQRVLTRGAVTHRHYRVVGYVTRRRSPRFAAVSPRIEASPVAECRFAAVETPARGTPRHARQALVRLRPPGSAGRHSCHRGKEGLGAYAAPGRVDRFDPPTSADESPIAPPSPARRGRGPFTPSPQENAS